MISLVYVKHSYGLARIPLGQACELRYCVGDTSVYVRFLAGGELQLFSFHAPVAQWAYRELERLLTYYRAVEEPGTVSWLDMEARDHQEQKRRSEEIAAQNRGES